MKSTQFDERWMYARYGLASVVRRRVGLISNVIQPAGELGAPSFEIAVTRLGAVSTLLPYVTPPRPGQVDTRGGAGADPDRELAWVRAVAEGAERYANIVHDQADFIVASAVELGDAAVDLDRLPRCSKAEFANPRCPLRAPSKTEPMRWARGVSLISGRELHVPAAFVHLFVPSTPAERITFPISTGVAAHPDLASALLGALCEVVERDAIALTWLARLPLPRIELPATPPAPLAPFLDRLTSSRVEQHFFDATTDLGVPTVLSIQIARGHPSCAIFVSASTSFDASACIAKTIREAAPGRLAMAWDREVPDRVEDFFELTHGADYYRTGDRLDDFAFLLDDGRRVPLAGVGAVPPSASGAAPGAQLRWLLGRLQALGMDAVALDLTTAELRDAGLWAVRVIVPELMPISFVHRARFLGTPRLYRYAQAVGHPLTEDAVNPNPLPFA